MSENKTQKPEARIDVKRQVRQAKQLVREAGRALSRFEQKTGVVLIVPRRDRASEKHHQRAWVVYGCNRTHHRLGCTATTLQAKARAG